MIINTVCQRSIFYPKIQIDENTLEIVNFCKKKKNDYFLFQKFKKILRILAQFFKCFFFASLKKKKK